MRFSGSGSADERLARHAFGNRHDGALGGAGIELARAEEPGFRIGHHLVPMGNPAERWWVRLQEKGGKRHEMPAHHKLEQFLDEYLAAAGIRDHDKNPLFRSAAGRTGYVTEAP